MFIVLLLLHAGRKKTGKAREKEAVEIKRQTEAGKISAWVQKHRVSKSNLINQYGKLVLPVTWLEDPGAMAARELTNQSTSTVDNSMTHMGKIDIFSNVEAICFTNDLIKCGLNQSNLVLDINKPKPEALHFYTIVGNNTREAVYTRHISRPSHVDYQFLHSFLICCEDTPDNRLMAKAYGLLENKAKDSRTKSATWDNILTLHNSYVRLLGNRLAKKDLKAAWIKEKNMINVSYVGSQGSFDQNVTVAMHIGVVWECIYKIFKGDVAVNKVTGKPPTRPGGVGHFKLMGGVPDSKLESWLLRIVEGDEELSDFTTHITNYKKATALQQEIVQFVGIQRDREDLTWEVIQIEWPSVAEPEYFRALMSWVGSVGKSTLTEAVKQEIIKRMELDEKEGDDDGHTV